MDRLKAERQRRGSLQCRRTKIVQNRFRHVQVYTVPETELSPWASLGSRAVENTVGKGRVTGQQSEHE
jgi:hypothetical protein